MSDKQTKKTKAKDTSRELIITVVQVVLAVVVLRTFLFQPFVIPSGSMQPTILIGDYVISSKFSYGYSRYSIPFAPNLFSGRIWGSEPKRGDIAIFNHWSERDGKNLDYIKRVIGLPGDRIQMRQSVLYINDEAVPRVKVGEINDADVTGAHMPVEVYRETLPNGVSYNTLDLGLTQYDNTRVYTVGEGHFFMMGDNRDNSDDSRISLGDIPYEEFVGRANLIFFSIGNGASAWQLWKWPSDVRWGRIGHSVNSIQFFPPTEPTQ